MHNHLFKEFGREKDIFDENLDLGTLEIGFARCGGGEDDYDYDDDDDVSKSTLNISSKINNFVHAM